MERNSRINGLRVTIEQSFAVQAFRRRFMDSLVPKGLQRWNLSSGSNHRFRSARAELLPTNCGDEDPRDTDSIDGHNAHLRALRAAPVERGQRHLHRELRAENLAIDQEILRQGLRRSRQRLAERRHKDDTRQADLPILLHCHLNRTDSLDVPAPHSSRIGKIWPDNAVMLRRHRFRITQWNRSY